MVATADRSDHDDEKVLIFFASFFFWTFWEPTGLRPVGTMAWGFRFRLMEGWGLRRGLDSIRVSRVGDLGGFDLGKKLGLEWIMVWATVLMGIRVEVSRLWVVGVGVLAD